MTDPTPRTVVSPPRTQALRVVEVADAAAWDAFVDGCADATLMHRWAWKRVMEEAYGHTSFFLGAVEGDRLCGVLPLTLVKSRLLGRRIVSMPFMDYGGLCTDGRADADRALAAAAVDLARGEEASLELRHVGDRPIDMPRSLDKVTMLLRLEGDQDAQWKLLPSERRNRIRKGLRLGLDASLHGPEAVREFHRVLAVNMRDLGSPAHARRFFDLVVDGLGESARILLVRSDHQVIGGALLLRHRDTISIPYVSSLRRFFERCPNQVLYWEAMRFAIAEGARTLDFGRSSRGAGTFEAKRQWGAQPTQLHWHYFPSGGGPPEDELRRLAWAQRLWRRLPLPVTKAAGPWIRRRIPR
jgi:FemAB-related protein (PEP-CTERM system-associated)